MRSTQRYRRGAAAGASDIANITEYFIGMPPLGIRRGRDELGTPHAALYIAIHAPGTDLYESKGYTVWQLDGRIGECDTFEDAQALAVAYATKWLAHYVKKLQSALHRVSPALCQLQLCGRQQDQTPAVVLRRFLAPPVRRTKRCVRHASSV